MSDFNLFYFMQLKVQRLVFLKEALSFLILYNQLYSI